MEGVRKVIEELTMGVTGVTMVMTQGQYWTVFHNDDIRLHTHYSPYTHTHARMHAHTHIFTFIYSYAFTQKYTHVNYTATLYTFTFYYTLHIKTHILISNI